MNKWEIVGELGQMLLVIVLCIAGIFRSITGNLDGLLYIAASNILLEIKVKE